MRNWQICPELTNICNMRCVLCPHSVEGHAGPSGNAYKRSAGMMSAQLWEKCLAACVKYGKELSLGFFGEQTMHPQFSQFLGMIPLKRKYKVVLNTNWSYITEEDFPVLLLILDELRISIDSISPKVYAKICNVRGSFYDLKGFRATIDRDYLSTIEEKLLAWLSKPHTRTKLIFTQSSYNTIEKPLFVRKWRNHLTRRDSVCVKSCVSFGGVMKDPVMSVYPCTIPRERRMIIGHDGTCSPCNLDVNLALNVGNLNDVDDMAEIVRSRKYKEVMRGIRRRQGICQNCFDANNRRLTKNYPGLRRVV